MGTIHDLASDACFRDSYDFLVRRARMDWNVDGRDGLFKRTQNGEACVASAVALPGSCCSIGV